MDIPTRLENTCLRVLNIVAKLVAVIFIIAINYFMLPLLYRVLMNNNTNIPYVEILVPISILLVLGKLFHLILTAKPYYPKAYHDYYKRIGKFKEE